VDEDLSVLPTRTTPGRDRLSLYRLRSAARRRCDSRTERAAEATASDATPFGRRSARDRTGIGATGPGRKSKC